MLRTWLVVDNERTESSDQPCSRKGELPLGIENIGTPLRGLEIGPVGARLLRALKAVVLKQSSVTGKGYTERAARRALSSASSIEFSLNEVGASPGRSYTTPAVQLDPG
jgi:hypothetical protein